MRARFGRMESWLADRWVAGAGFMAAALLASTPLLAMVAPLALVLIFLHSPGYMMHQVEEHAGDRFRRFANDRVFGGREALTTPAVLVINVGVVWLLNLGALYAALAWGAGYGLVAPYAMLVNALTHIGARLRLGAYNPGLMTAVVLFLPLSVTTIAVIGMEPEVGWRLHAAGLAGALLLHLAIVAHVALRLRRLPG
ncbi:HXXEE domain-containing protein [Starkeya koreensis]|uniref:HXXEE domain-containing protein n=1 Tax=Ancylobacter koreensis TaxID=266121 RepID=A0ABT0DN43_9HYPH|nr:HXXEE domain-containing protein [Ancylobacter koreensis]MCK0208695.1 HXXEE domain-containing protein [Ancylobacter koreensis]